VDGLSKGLKAKKPIQIKSIFKRIAVLMVVAFMAACASAPPADDPESVAEFKQINDPIEPFNRAIFGFNQGVDKAVIKPITGVYRTIAPDPVRRGVHNFLGNLRAPVILFNDIMQGEMERAGTTIMRFLINSTVGILGFRDQAAEWGYAPHREDFGQTLAVWSVPEGPYVMLPVLGPSNPRDAVGIVVDFLIDPLNWWASNTDREYITYTRTAVSGIDTRDQLWDVLEDLERSSIDYYAAIRSLYRQRRADEIRNGATPGEPPAPGFTGSVKTAAQTGPLTDLSAR